MQELEKASDDQLLAMLEDAHLADVVENSLEWKIIHQAMKRVVHVHEKMLRKVDPTDSKKIIELQQIINMYDDDFLPTLIRNLKAIGQFAYDEAGGRGLLDDFLGKVENSI